MSASEALGGISEVSLEEPEIFVICVDETKHGFCSLELATELSDVNIDAGLVDNESSLGAVELEESPLTARGSDWKARVDRSTDADSTRLFHVEGESEKRGVLLHLRPGGGANLRIVTPEPEIVIDPV